MLKVKSVHEKSRSILSGQFELKGKDHALELWARTRLIDACRREVYEHSWNTSLWDHDDPTAISPGIVLPVAGVLMIVAQSKFSS